MSGCSQQMVNSAVICMGTGRVEVDVSLLQALMLKAQWPEEPTVRRCALAPGEKTLPCLGNDSGAGEARGEPATSHVRLSAAAAMVRPLWRGPRLQVQRPHICPVVELALAAGAQALARLAHGVDADGAEGVAALDHAVLLPPRVADLAVQALAHVLQLPGLCGAAALQPARAAHRQLGNLCLRRPATRDVFMVVSWAARLVVTQS